MSGNFCCRRLKWITQNAITVASQQQEITKQTRLACKNGKLVMNPRPVICGISVNSRYFLKAAAAKHNGNIQPAERAAKRKVFMLNCLSWRGSRHLNVDDRSIDHSVKHRGNWHNNWRRGVAIPVCLVDGVHQSVWQMEQTDIEVFASSCSPSIVSERRAWLMQLPSACSLLPIAIDCIHQSAFRCIIQMLRPTRLRRIATV